MLAMLQRKRLRRIAHHLEPIIVVGERGLNAAVIGETKRALTDHELIKARLNLSDRNVRKECGRSLAEHCAAQIVQEIGKVIVLYRENPDADPHLSNLTRHS